MRGSKSWCEKCAQFELVASLPKYRSRMVAMEEKTLKENALSHCEENQGAGGECAMNSTPVNKEYEIVTAVSDNYFCEIIKLETSENGRDDSTGTESLESFYERPEAIDPKWIEIVQKDTKALERWRKHATTSDFKTIKGQAFNQCPLLHPHEEIPSAKHDRNVDFENQHLVTLESTLSRISKVTRRNKLQCFRVDAEQKFHPDIKNKSSFTHGVPPDVALENYCQQHAYSRARLLRTDRRALANELLDRLATNSDETGIVLTQSSGCDSTLISETSQFSPQLFKMKKTSPTQEVEEGQADDLPGSCHENLNRRDPKSLSYPSFPGRTANAIRLNKDYEQSKETRGRALKTSWGTPPADDMNEPFKITPCALFPSQVPYESRNRILRRNSSVPRYTPRLIN